MDGHSQNDGRSGGFAVGSFGSFLVGRGLVKQAEIEEAKRSLAVYGGRLGTNLVELGYLGLEELSAELAAYHGASLPPNEWLDAPDEKATRLVPKALVRKLRLLPLHLERDAIHVAMMDPRDPEHLDFVATAASRPVVAYVLPEIRLLYWLEVHLKIDRHPRFVNLAARLRRTDMRVPESDDGALRIALEPQRQTFAAASAPSPVQAPDLLDQWFEESAPTEPEFAIGAPEASPRAVGPVDEPVELLLEELFLEIGEVTVPASTLPGADLVPLRPAEIAALEATLDGAGRRDDILEIVLRIARNYCEVAVLFLVRGESVTPICGSGGRIEGRLEGIELPLRVHSVFAHPAVTGFPFRGSPPDGGIDARLLAALGREDIAELLVQPICISGRVVNLLYCDNGASAFGETSIAALGALADRAALAYERLILDRKREGQR